MTTTFGSLIDGGYSVYAVCNSVTCSNSSPLPLEDLAQRFGRDHGAMHQDLIRMRFRCSKCRGRDVSFRLVPGGKQYSFYQPDDDPPF